MKTRPAFGQGITGWAVVNREPVLANQAHLDSRVAFIPGTPAEPEALVSIPLIARGALKGALNIYRLGETASFDEDEFELAKWFGDAAALALDNAQVRARLEHQAQTDSLTGLYNHRNFHERLRAELMRASRARDSVALLMFDIDEFKRVNDICGHAVGDQILVAISELTNSLVRTSDVVCRLGGEEFAVIMPSCNAGDALGLARRLTERLGARPMDAAGEITISVGVAHGPENAGNPRDLIDCAESAMMAAKARGKNRIVVYAGDIAERPDVLYAARDIRSVAHLKMLQSVAARLNRLNSVKDIAEAIVSELRGLIDYHSCRVYLVEGDEVFPVAIKGDGVTEEEQVQALRIKIGTGVTGYVAETGPSGAGGECARVRLRDPDPGHGEGGRVRDRRAAPLRRPRHGRRLPVEAGRRAVRRERPAVARGAGRLRGSVARERAPLREPAARGRSREGVARVRRRDLRRRVRGADRRGDRQGDRGDSSTARSCRCGSRTRGQATSRASPARAARARRSRRSPSCGSRGSRRRASWRRRPRPRRVDTEELVELFRSPEVAAADPVAVAPLPCGSRRSRLAVRRQAEVGQASRTSGCGSWRGSRIARRWRCRRRVSRATASRASTSRTPCCDYARALARDRGRRRRRAHRAAGGGDARSERGLAVAPGRARCGDGRRCRLERRRRPPQAHPRRELRCRGRAAVLPASRTVRAPPGAVRPDPRRRRARPSAETARWRRSRSTRTGWASSWPAFPPARCSASSS